MSLLNVESYVFNNVFYLVLFCIHVVAEYAAEKKTAETLVGGQKGVNSMFCGSSVGGLVEAVQFSFNQLQK